MNDESTAPTRWETFRFSVVGPLLAAPPSKGELQKALKTLAEQAWRHPITGKPVVFSFATIERWYYKARGGARGSGGGAAAQGALRLRHAACHVREAASGAARAGP